MASHYCPYGRFNREEEEKGSSLDSSEMEDFPDF